ncbi:MAG: FIST signal transduction protein [Myxococcales bacterium]
MNRIGTGHSDGVEPLAAGESAARAAVQALGEVKPRLVLTFGAPSYAYPELIRGIKRAVGDAALLGCSTAGEFTHEAVGHGSVAVMALGGDNFQIATGIGRGLRNNRAAAIRDAMASFAPAYRAARQQGFAHATCVVLTDGLAGNGEELVESIHEQTNSLAQVVGGAAADAAKFEKTEVIFDDRAETDAVAVASIFTRTPIGIGVQHGLTPATTAKVVTKASGGILGEIDGKPAFQAYVDYAKSKGIDLDEKNRDAFMIVNELGMVTPDGHKIRAPLKANPDGSLLMATEVPAGTAVCIMGGSSDSLVSASRQAAESALRALGGAKPAGTLVFDCICRRIFLGDGYRKQIDAIAQAAGGMPLAGWETYGEIALTHGQASGFHNSTSVIAVLPA